MASALLKSFVFLHSPYAFLPNHLLHCNKIFRFQTITDRLDMPSNTNLDAKKRPVYRNINIFTDVRSYRLPPAAIVSILHRVSGLIMFLLLPFILWMFDNSLSSEISYDSFTNIFVAGFLGFPAWFVKLGVLVLCWSFFHHLIAGVRHLWMDATHSVTKEFGRQSAVVTLVLSVLLTIALGAKLFGLF